MKILLIGDVFGEAGRRAVTTLVPRLREQHSPDLVIANGENAANGAGLTPRLAQQIFAAGVDGITLGNHAFRRRDLLPMLNTSDRIVRPANFSPQAPGTGSMVIEVGGVRVAVFNLMGNLYLQASESPFHAADRMLDECSADVVVIDFHAEATSEKVAFGAYMDGRASVVAGTHTHVQTSDARVLAKGTAYITDLGMTGPHDSVIGVRTDIIVTKFVTDVPARFEPSVDGVQLEGALVDIDEATGRARSIVALREKLDEPV